MNMQIAGVNFSISSRPPVSFKNPAPKYLSFLDSKEPAIDSIDISLELENFPDTAKMTRIFDSVQSWALFLDEDDYFLEYKPPVFREPFWIAHCDSTFEKATIHFGGMLASENDGKSTFLNPLFYPFDQLLIMHLLTKRTGALLHAAGLSMDNRGYIFPGRSGAGKSTLSRLFLGRDKAEMLSDDRMIIRKIDGKFKAFGTPWAGDADIAENKSVLLNGIFFIHQAETNMVKEIKPKEAIKRLMPVTSIPWYDEKFMFDILSFCEDLVLNIPAYELHFRPDAEVVTFIDDLIVRGKI